MLAEVTSGALLGIEARAVQVEVNAAERGEPRFVVVGLPDEAVKESRDRVFSALANSGYLPPETRTTVNLAPGDLRKEGPAFDLPMALATLASTAQMAAPRLRDFLIAGELGLSGEVRAVRGGLALALRAREEGKAALLLPTVTAEEAALVEGVKVYAVRSLSEAVTFLEGRKELAPLPSPLNSLRERAAAHRADFSDLKGQAALRRALEVAVAGGHNVLMIGPPGSGKSMAAKRLAGIMPEPALGEFLEILAIQSAAGITLQDGRRFERPFRSPHHTISDIGLIGGGTIPGPGEISLAHHGVLFLDELPEFKRSALEVLRQPLEEGEVTISRSAAKVTLPCSFMLVAAMNPCPCGYLGDPKHECRCSAPQVQRYRARISGPLLDRIDIHVEAPALSIGELRTEKPGEPSESMRGRVARAREVQQARFGPKGPACNARMDHRQLRSHAAIDPSLGDLLQHAMEELSLSARAYDRILKVARTIADLAGAETIGEAHLLEAIQYRSLDRTVMY